MLQTLHTHCIFLSIAGIRPFVECGLQAGPGPDLFQQLRRPQIPGVLPDALIAIQDGRVLCPAQFRASTRSSLPSAQARWNSRIRRRFRGEAPLPPGQLAWRYSAAITAVCKMQSPSARLI